MIKVQIDEMKASFADLEHRERNAWASPEKKPAAAARNPIKMKGARSVSLIKPFII